MERIVERLLERQERMEAALEEIRRELVERQERMQATLEQLSQERPRQWYSTSEVAQILGKSEFTVREYARLGRIHAKKKLSGRGGALSWVISHEELLRIRKEGLLPIKRS
jgi:hypothetical protein